jgi:galactose oxidase-like protein
VVGGVRRFPLLVCALVLAITASARANHPAPGERNLSEAQLRAAEAQFLGPEHAAEHARERAAQTDEKRHGKRLSPSDRRRIARHDRREAEQFAELSESTGAASEVGRWTHAPFQIPHAAINATALPTGEVLFWGSSFPNEPRNRGNAALWDQSKGHGSAAFTEVPPPSIDPDGPGPQETDTAPLFCSGVSTLASGEVLVTGGTLVWPGQYSDDAYTAFAGLDRAFTFNPWTRTWTEQPQMNAGRWYPGQVELSDGRTVVLSGYTDEAPGGIVNEDFEVFTPASEPGGVGSLTLEPSGQRKTALYPHLFTLPNSKVLLAGPGGQDSALLSTADFTWQELPRPSRNRTGGNAVLNPPGGPAGSWRVTQIGGYPNRADAQGNHAAIASTETIDAGHPSQGWKTGPSLNIPRSYQNTVLLPDGSMVAVGGGIGYTPADQKYAIDPNGQQRQVELYNPSTKKWRLGPAEIEDRGYHSTALLLPNGRVWSAGDEKHPLEPDGGWALTDTAEIYSPPYLFKGPRPRIVSAPSQLSWGDEFGVQVGTSVPADSAVLVAPGATTHGADYAQRVVKLAVRRTYTGGIDLAAPSKAGIAPPGYYMLFVLHNGVPSIASWVQLTPDAP